MWILRALLVPSMCIAACGGAAKSGLDAGAIDAQGGASDAGHTSPDLAPDAGGFAPEPDDAGEPRVDVIRYVDPFIGTDDSSSPHPVPGGAGGSTYPGAVVPFGMVQISPDTPTASPSGYRFRDPIIEQFSLTHFDGAGCANNEDFPFLPVVGELAASPGSNWPSYRTTYSKSTEIASPGYYGVELDPNGVRVELTATVRTGFARFTFPASEAARVLIHSGRSATGVREGSVEILGPDRVRGTAIAGGFCGSSETFRVHFFATFDPPFSRYGTWLGATVSPESSSAEGAAAGAYLSFDTSASKTVQMKIGLSFVSAENAEANLLAESPSWDFDMVRGLAEDRWRDVLERVLISGGSEEDLTKFYSALYHVFQSPNVASDVNGEYMGFDRRVHTATDRVVYQNYSGWDIIRSWTHLVSALAPETPDIIRSMVQDGIEGGLLPFWTHQNVETRVMVGDPGTVNVANAYAMGVRGFDVDAALELMTRSASDPSRTHRWGLADWMDVHYVGNAAVTLEYAMADFALAEFAAAIGDARAHEGYMARSDYWKESFNPASGYIEPRVARSGAGDAARIYEVEVFGPGSPSENLALGKTASASGACNADEGPEKAANGTWTAGLGDKWCDNVVRPRWWQVDLGSQMRVDRVVLHHAGTGGESRQWNTRDFSVRTSTNGVDWSTVASVEGNTRDESTHAFDSVEARHVRLEVTAAIQGGRSGDWDCRPFDAASECGFVEGNASQYVWMVPHNMEALFGLMGGHAAAIERLDEHFVELNAGTNRPYFYIGNEPEHGTPWTYNFAEAPWRTQEVVRRIASGEFNTTPGGLPGNDDLGATSAWLVWAYLGMYPVIPGTDVLVIHGPAFPSATLRLANGETVQIRAAGAGPGAPYVQGLEVNGVPTTRTWLSFAEIAGGATLDFSMDAAPDPTWGGAAADRPPSFEP